MKKGIKILLGAIIVVVIGFGLLTFINRPISEAAVNEKIKTHLTKVLKKMIRYLAYC